MNIPATLPLVAISCVTLIASAAVPRRSTNDRDRTVEELTAATRASLAVITHSGRDGQQDGVGAGFVIARDGLVATCLHVIGEGRPIRVQFANGNWAEVLEIFASDQKLDLAILRVAATNLTPIKLGDSDALPQGAAVIALGNPLGLEHSVVSGVVSARREVAGNRMIQLAMPIEPGNSGGPLLDRAGRVQGILTLKDAMSANLGFAMPVNALKRLLEHPNPVPMDRWLRLASLDAGEWSPQSGAGWRRKAGGIHVEGAGSGFGGRSLCWFHQAAPEMPYEVAVTVRLDDESGAAGLIFGGEGERHYGFYPTAGKMRLTRFDGPNVFAWTILKEFTTPHYHASDWNTIKVRVETNRIVGFVNGAQVMIATDDALRGRRVGIAKFRQTVADFRAFKVSQHVGSPAPSPALVQAVKQAAEQVLKSIDPELLNEPRAARERALAEAHELDRKAAHLRAVANELNTREVQQELVKTFADGDDSADLFHAAMLVAKLDNPELDIAPYRAELKRMTGEVRRRLAAGATDTQKLDAISRYLFAESGFHGSRSDFYNRANSYLNDVIDDREGLPITLAVLYLELARELGVRDVSGIPVPTRFMVRHAPKQADERIIDVFDGGKILTRSEAVDLVADDAERITDDDFAPATKRAVIARMLRNLLGVSRRTNDFSAESLRYLDVLLVLEPDATAERIERARIRARSGDVDGAKADARWLLDHEPEGLDLERLAEWYRSL